MNLTETLMLKALKALDQRLKKSVHLIVGGGGAMLLAHRFSLTTSDIDAVPAQGMTVQELDPLVKAVGEELGIAPDWLNPYYSSFAHVLPQDYGTRLIQIGSYDHLRVSALSKEDLLIMKCFAARLKDVVHARALFKGIKDLSIVKNQILFLEGKRIPGTEKAKKFLSEIEHFFSSKDDE